MTVIFSYTRSEAIEDGVLCEMSDEMRLASGMLLPTVVTATVMEHLRSRIIENLTQEEARDDLAVNLAWSDATLGLLKECSRMARELGAQSRHDCDTRFVVKWEGYPVIVEIGPDDMGDPCWTVMCSEDG